MKAVLVLAVLAGIARAECGETTIRATVAVGAGGRFVVRTTNADGPTPDALLCRLQGELGLTPIVRSRLPVRLRGPQVRSGEATLFVFPDHSGDDFGQRRYTATLWEHPRSQLLFLAKRERAHANLYSEHGGNEDLADSAWSGRNRLDPRDRSAHVDGCRHGPRQGSCLRDLGARFLVDAAREPATREDVLDALGQMLAGRPSAEDVEVVRAAAEKQPYLCKLLVENDIPSSCR